MLWFAIGLSIALHAIIGLAGAFVFPAFRWTHYPIHAGVELTGALIAYMVAFLMWVLEKRKKGSKYNLIIATALIGMGTLDGLHALVHAGKAFVWLHSTATFLGGALFLLVWLPDKIIGSIKAYWLPVSFFVTSTFGGVSLAFSQMVPPMVIDGQFTVLAKSLNMGGGIFLFIAAFKLIKGYLANRNIDDLLFSMHCLLFGAAAIMFENSVLWDFSWWGWHFLRFLAYGFALWFVALAEIREIRANDVLARKLSNFNQKLEERVNELTTTLRQRNSLLEENNEVLHYEIAARKQIELDLRAAKQEADLANKTKGDFLANMSHEIRTPMNGVIGMTSLLLSTQLNDEQRDYADTIHFSANSLLTIINDILDFSKLESGNIELESIAFNLRQCVEGVVDMLLVEAQKKQLALNCLVKLDVPDTLLGDPTRLRQILLNLTSNALKFTHTGEVLLFADVESETESQVIVRFEVSDTGIGIPQDRLNRLFKSFSQVDSSTTRKFGGTGLGLAISKSLCEVMGGAIGVESEVDEGSTFWFTCGFKKSDTKNQIAPFQKRTIEKRKILVIEQSLTNQQILTEYLEPFSCELIIADNINTMQSIQDEHQIDLVLIDSDKHDCSAVDLNHSLSNKGTSNQLPVLLLTAAHAGPETESCTSDDISGHLSKPIKRDRLYQALYQLLSTAVKVVPDTTSGSNRDLPIQSEIYPRVLFVDDNPQSQEIARKTLSKLGYEVEVLTNGVEALRVVTGKRFDLIIMDFQLQGLDVIEATTNIYKHQTDLSRPPVLAMISLETEVDWQNCLNAGISDYILSPVNAGELINQVKRWTKASALDGEVAPLVH